MLFAIMSIVYLAGFARRPHIAGPVPTSMAVSAERSSTLAGLLSENGGDGALRFPRPVQQREEYSGGETPMRYVCGDTRAGARAVVVELG